MNDKKVQHMFLHVDLDAFFASVEQLDHPEYKGKPVIVGGRPEDRRGVVSTASYEARKFGVHSAMPVYQAYKLCPQGIFVHGNMRRYAEISYQVMTIFKDFSPDIQQMSIDEALIDLTGTEKLFGPADQVALKIKERVKRETGLTVSVGLASTQYIAKIASGYSKPDGFYFVHPGDETDFMLSLPLDKIWGAGKKTQEIMRLKVIQTTRDIYEKDLDLLQFMFGTNLGSFLYNAVRGNEDLSFSHQAKSHSISAETTFPYDINDIYTAETSLMELCYGVYFRLLSNECFSRTITLKLRYDDFTTTNAQITYDRNITTLDSFFEKIKALFETKYEKGRGIRLLGVGFDNVENVDRPYQQDLFESDTSKKSKIEKAILNLEKKHPEIKVQKARMLKNKTLSFFTGLGLLTVLLISTPQKLSAKENKTEAKGAAAVLPDGNDNKINDKIGKSLFNWEINDANTLDFLISGYWKASFEDNLFLSFGNNSGVALNPGAPVFKQEVDISFWAVLNKQWTFKVDFADEFTKNTISLGYKGSGHLKSALVSNRNITMPDTYAANYFGYGLSGGDSQSPGFNMHFEDSANSLWNGDFLVRYDMTQSKNATFYGLNNVSDTYIEINNFEYGRTFVFPKDAWSSLSDISDIYVEAKSGSFTDENGKKYKKLSSDQYIIFPGSGKLLISTGASAGKSKTSSTNIIPSVLVKFTDKNNIQLIEKALGTYKDTKSYLGAIQLLFSDYDFSKYAYKLNTKIDNENALIIQNSTGFSPFLVCQTYDCGIISEADVTVLSKNAGKPLEEFQTELTDDQNATTITNFFSEKHKYVKVFTTNDSSADLQNPINRYPFAYTNPEIYLNLAPKTDTSLLIRTYSKVNNLNIGTNAIAGSVQVYKNGILDIGAKYEASTGNVILSSAINTTDKIYIIWQEDNSAFGNGAIVAGAGFNYLFSNNLNANLAITSRWPITPFKKYSSVQDTQKSFTALSSGIEYSLEHFKISDKLALAMENQNGTGVLLASTQDSNISKTYYLSSGSGYETQVNPVLNVSTPIELLNENNCTGVLRAAQTDPQNISGYKVPLDFDFSNKNDTEPLWASVDIQLSSGNLLKNASQLEVALKNEKDMTGYEYYIQLGVNASSTFYGEEKNLIPTWKVNDSNTDGLFDYASTSWQSVTLQLDELSRSKLSSYHDARLIVIKKPDTQTTNSSGTVYFGPYEPYTEVLFTKADSNISVNTQTIAQSTPSSQELLINPNYSTLLNWNYLSSPTSGNDTKIIGVRYFEASDFSPYKTINFDFAFVSQDEEASSDDNNSQFELILDNSAKNCSEDGNIALKVVLHNIKPYISSNIKYHTLSINIASKQVSIDEQQLNSGDFEVEINKNEIPNRQKIILDTKINDTLISKGALYIDNLYYKETSPVLLAQNNLDFSYSYKDNIVTVNNYDLIKNAKISLNSTQSAQTLISNSQNSSAQINANAEAGITIAGININTDVNVSSAGQNNQLLQNAGHKLSTEKALFKIISLNETYRLSLTDKSLKKSDSATLDFSQIKVPLKINFTGNATESSSVQNQSVLCEFNFNPKIKETGINFTSSLKANQKINQQTTKNYSNTNNYFSGYYDISALEFSTGEEKAQNRNIDFVSKINVSLPWAKLSPALEYDLSSKYVNSTEVSLSDTHVFKFSVPFTLSSNNFSFTYTRTGVGEGNISNTGTYISDGSKVLSDLNNRGYFYSGIPLYDLFDSSISEKMNPLITNNTTNNLSSKYELIWKRKLFNTYYDLFIPSTSSFAISRDLKYTENLSDLYQIKAVLANNSINIFGSKSKLKLFKWYSHEEIQSSLTGIVKIPASEIENTTFQTTLYSQILFYIADKNTLQTAFDFSIETNLDWKFTTTLIWQYPGKTTFIIPLLEYIPLFQDSNPGWKISRKDTVNIQIGNKDFINTQIYQIYHNLDLNFFKNYTISAGVGLDFNYVQNSRDNLSLKFTLGAKMIW